MYTLNLKDIQLTEAFADKHFENIEEYRLIDEVSKYIQENYPASFPNPVTLERKIAEAIKNEEGLNRKEMRDKRNEEIDAEITDQNELRKAKTAPIREKYEKLMMESKEKFDVERRSLLNEQSSVKEDEAYEAIEVKIENNSYQAQQDFERLLKEQREAIKAAEAELENS